MQRMKCILTSVIGLAAACGDGPTLPPPGGSGMLVLSPGAILFPEPGEARQLRAYTIDQDGDSTEVEAQFESSNASVVTVDGNGVATAGPALGSAQVTARSGDLVSAPILALRATPASGAVLVADSQVIGEISAVDSAAVYGPGWHYRVRLRGLSLSAGDVVLASGGAPIGGRVVSSAAAGSDIDVVLQLIGLDEMFADLAVDERLSLTNAELGSPDRLRDAFDLRRTPEGGLRLASRRGSTPLRAGLRSPAAQDHDAIEQEFERGPFDCKAEVPPAFTFPLTLDVFSLELNQTLSLDLVIADASLQRFVIEGGIAPRITANPRLTAALEAKAECKVQIATLILPIGGPLALIVGGQVPLGVGFEVGAKASFGELGIDAFLESSITAKFGIDCAPGCQVVADIGGTAPSGFFKPILPALGTDTRFELSASAFGWADLAIGNRFFQALQFKAVEMKAGMEQKFELAAPEVQAADAAYASSYTLKPVIEAKAAANLTPIADLLRINLATLTFAPGLPTISQSARGTFAITPASVAAGDGTQLGDMATFTVNLTDLTYFGAYAIEAVQLRWRRTVGETVVLESGRPGCTDLEAAQDQVTFTCQTDFLEEHVGTQTFHAFVKTRIWGVPIPVPLEIAADARAAITVVQLSSALEWTFDEDNEGWLEGGEGTVFHLDRGFGLLKLHATDSDVGTADTWIYQDIALPATARTLAFRVSAHDRDGATVGWRVRLVDAAGTSHILHGWEILTGAEGVLVWVDRSVPIQAFAGTTVTIYVEQDDNGESNHEHFYIDRIQIVE